LEEKEFKKEGILKKFILDANNLERMRFKKAVLLQKRLNKEFNVDEEVERLMQ